MISADPILPVNPNIPYSHLYFYSGHTDEILTTVFEPDIISVKTLLTAGNIITVFKYTSLGVCVNFPQGSVFYAAMYGAQEAAGHLLRHRLNDHRPAVSPSALAV